MKRFSTRLLQEHENKCVCVCVFCRDLVVGCLSGLPGTSALPTGHGLLSSVTHLSVCAVQLRLPEGPPRCSGSISKQRVRPPLTHPGGRERAAADRQFCFCFFWMHVSIERKCSFHESVISTFVTNPYCPTRPLNPAEKNLMGCMEGTTLFC